MAINSNNRDFKYFLMFVTCLMIPSIALRIFIFIGSEDHVPDTNCTIYGPLNSGGVIWAVNSSNKAIPGSTVTSNDGASTIKRFNDTYNKFENTNHICFYAKMRLCRNNKINKSSNSGFTVVAFILEVLSFVAIVCGLIFFGVWRATYDQLD